MISWNDLVSAPRLVTSADIDEDALVTGPVRIYGITLTGGADAATLIINDALTKAGGGTTITLNAGIATSTFLNFGPHGIRFPTGLSIDNTGTTPTGSVSYQAE